MRFAILLPVIQRVWFSKRLMMQTLITNMEMFLNHGMTVSVEFWAAIFNCPLWHYAEKLKSLYQDGWCWGNSYISHPIFYYCLFRNDNSVSVTILLSVQFKVSTWTTWDRSYINLVCAISIRFTVKRIYCFSWPIFRCPILHQNIPWTYFVHGMMTKGIQLRGDQLRQKLRPLVLYYIASPCLAIESSVPLSFLSPSCLAPRAVVVLGWEARQKLRPLVLTKGF